MSANGTSLINYISIVLAFDSYWIHNWRLPIAQIETTKSTIGLIKCAGWNSQKRKLDSIKSAIWHWRHCISGLVTNQVIICIPNSDLSSLKTGDLIRFLCFKQKGSWYPVGLLDLMPIIGIDLLHYVDRKCQ